MIAKQSIDAAKHVLQQNIGKSIRLTSKKGRKKPIVRHGIIEQTFSSVFVIKLSQENCEEAAAQRVSYSYTDILTKSIELALC